MPATANSAGGQVTSSVPCIAKNGSTRIAAIALHRARRQKLAPSGQRCSIGLDILFFPRWEDPIRTNASGRRPAGERGPSAERSFPCQGPACGRRGGSGGASDKHRGLASACGGRKRGRCHTGPGSTERESVGGVKWGDVCGE